LACKAAGLHHRCGMLFCSISQEECCAGVMMWYRMPAPTDGLRYSEYIV
jgi:hypothetical protein